METPAIDTAEPLRPPHPPPTPTPQGFTLQTREDGGVTKVDQMGLTAG